jgi:phosphate transport system permease protein
MLVCALSIFAIVLFIATILVMRSKLTICAVRLQVLHQQNWDPVSGDFGALPFIFGTLATSLLALLMAVPLALGVAIFLTELCPQKLRAPISFLTELLAAIPSVVYGLWAVFVLVPLMRDQWGRFWYKYLGWTGFFEGRTSAWAADGEHHPGDHDSADHLFADARHDAGGAEHISARRCWRWARRAGR